MVGATRITCGVGPSQRGGDRSGLWSAPSLRESWKLPWRLRCREAVRCASRATCSMWHLMENRHATTSGRIGCHQGSKQGCKLVSNRVAIAQRNSASAAFQGPPHGREVTSRRSSPQTTSAPAEIKRLRNGVPSSPQASLLPLRRAAGRCIRFAHTA